MAIQPIEIFQPPGGGLLGLFGNAQSALTNALNNAVDAGRRLADNQNGAQRDFLAEQRAQIGLEQRRAENAADNAYRQQVFDRGVLTSDRDYAQRLYEAGQADTLRERRDAREATFDALRLQNSVDEGSRADRRLAIDEARAKTVADDLAAEQQFNRDIMATGDSPDFVGPPAPGDANVRAADATARAKAALEVHNVPAYQEAIRDKARAEAEPDYSKPRTSSSEDRLQEQFDYRKEEDARREAERKATLEAKQAEKDSKAAEDEAADLLADTEAFRPHSADIEYADDGKTPKDPKAAALAKARDADRLGAERAAARTAGSRDAFISLGGPNLTKEQKAKRGRFYDLVVKGSAEAAATNSAEEDLFKGLTGK